MSPQQACAYPRKIPGVNIATQFAKDYKKALMSIPPCIYAVGVDISFFVGKATATAIIRDDSFPVRASASAVLNDLSPKRAGANSVIYCPSFTFHLRLRVRRGESQNADGESGEDSISNSPQGEYYLNFAGGGKSSNVA